MVLVLNQCVLRQAGSSSWTPLDMFTGSPGGAFWDISDGSTVQSGGVYNPSDGTTGCAVDDKSGNGYQLGYVGWTTGTYRLVGGVGTLEHANDSTSRRTGNHSINLQGKAAISMFVGVRFVTNPGYESTGDTSDGTSNICYVGGGNGVSDRLVIGTKGGDQNYNSVSFPKLVHAVGVVDYQAGTWATYINGSAFTNGTFTGGSNSPATNSKISFWSQNGNFTLNAFYACAIGRAMTSTEIANSWTWGRAKLGI